INLEVSLSQVADILPLFVRDHGIDEDQFRFFLDDDSRRNGVRRSLRLRLSRRRWSRLLLLRARTPGKQASRHTKNCQTKPIHHSSAFVPAHEPLLPVPTFKFFTESPPRHFLRPFVRLRHPAQPGAPDTSRVSGRSWISH